MANGLLDIPMKMEPPEDEGSRIPPVGGALRGDTPTSAYNIVAPESALSGGVWERFAPGQFAYHPSPEDLELPDLIEHFAEIEVVGNLLVISMDEIYEGGISHDVDNDGQADAPTHPTEETPPMGEEPMGEEPSPMSEEPDGDGPSALPQDPGSKLPAPGGPNSWMNKKSGESNVPIPKQQY